MSRGDRKFFSACALSLQILWKLLRIIRRQVPGELALRLVVRSLPRPNRDPDLAGHVGATTSTEEP